MEIRDGVDKKAGARPLDRQARVDQTRARGPSTLVPKIIGVETADHPTDNQVVAHARSYFRAADRMRGSGPS